MSSKTAEFGFLECTSSILSLLPRTLMLSSEVGAAAAAQFEQQDDAIGSFFKTVALNNSKDCLEQAKVLLNGSSDLPGNGEKDFVENCRGCPRERRPGLGLKRARFSLKPSTRPSLGNLDVKPSMPMDPEEFFSYHEKLENADRELKKLLGQGAVSADPTQQYQTTTRQRRPGMLGKKAKYKPPIPLHADDVQMVSQEKVIEKGASSPCKSAIDIATQNSSRLSILSDLPHAMGTVTRSVSDEGKGENILDTLLSLLEGLDEDEGVAFLQERLHLKPLIVDRVRLPEIKRDQRDDVGGMKSKEIVQTVEGSLFTLSPTPSRRPLGTNSLLQSHFSQVDPPQDQCVLPPAKDVPSAGNSSLIEGRDGDYLSSAVDANQPDARNLSSVGASSPVEENGRRLNFMDKLKSLVSEPNKTAHSRIVMEEMLTADSPCSLDLQRDHNPTGFDSSSYLTSPGSDGCVQDKADKSSVLKSQSCGIASLTSETRNTTETEGTDGLLDCNVRRETRLDCDLGVGSSGVCGRLEAEVNEMLQESLESQAPEGLEDLSTPGACTNLPMDAPSEDLGTSQEQHNEELLKSGVPMMTKLKPKAPHNKERPRIRRKSLAGAGTKWEAGVRRSTRIKTRPLEYWRGERFLYGRIHDSLATVIGIKYASPGKDGSMQVLKVKSYVPETYAELVKKAALH